MMLSPFATFFAMVVAFCSYLLGAWIAVAPMRRQRRRRLVLLAMTEARGDRWTRSFELRQWERGAIDHHWIYRVLLELHTDGFVESRQASPLEMHTTYGSARGRIPFRWYRLTARGADLVDALTHERALDGQGFDCFL